MPKAPDKRGVVNVSSKQQVKCLPVDDNDDESLEDNDDESLEDNDDESLEDSDEDGSGPPSDEDGSI